MDIWQSFVEFLQNLIRQYGLFKLIFAFSGFGAALIGLALGFRLTQDMRIGLALVFVIGLLFLTCLALIIDQNQWRNKVVDANVVLNRYGEEIKKRQNAGSFDIKEWRDLQFVDKDGDTKIDRRFTLVVGNQPLQTFWHRMEMSSEGWEFQQQNKVTIKAKSFDAQTDQPNVSFLVSRRWEGNSVWNLCILTASTRRVKKSV